MRILSLIVVAAFIVSPALAHGPQVQVTFNQTTGQIETREIVDTASRPMSITDNKRVYVVPFMPVSGAAGDGWYTRPDTHLNLFGVPNHITGPGITFQYDTPAQLPGTGWSFSGSGSLPNLQGTNFGYLFADGLKEWNGATFVDPGAEQLQAFRGDGSSVPTIMINTTDAGPFASMPLSTINSMSSNPHSSIGYRLLGDGVSSGLTSPTSGDDGIYLASLILTSTASGVGQSDPFYYVMHKNRDVAAAIEAAESLGFDSSLIQVIPEPASLSLLSTAAAMLLIRKRRAAGKVR